MTTQVKNPFFSLDTKIITEHKLEGMIILNPHQPSGCANHRFHVR